MSAGVVAQASPLGAIIDELGQVFDNVCPDASGRVKDTKATNES